MKDIVIIGGGISGLATAYHLRRQHSVEPLVLESASLLGGKAKTRIGDGFTTETGTNGWLDKEPAMGALIASLGLTARLQPSDDAASKRYIYRRGALRQLHMNPARFLLGDALPFWSRLRVAMEPFVPRKRDDSDETLADFASRRLGTGARDLLIGPMAFGVYAGDPSQMSLSASFGKVADLERNHGGLVKGMIALKRAKRAAGEDPSSVQAGPSGRLTSLKGGMQDLIDALSAELSGCCWVDSPVVAVRRTCAGYTVHTENNAPIESRSVLSAAPAWAARDYLQTLDQEAAFAFDQIPYPALDVVCLGYQQASVPHRLDGFGFLVPRGEGLTMLGSLWTSSIFPGRAPSGHVLLRTMIGGMLHPEVQGWGEDELVSLVRDELAQVIGIPQGTEPVIERTFRHRKAIPQYHVGHAERRKVIAAAEARHPGFFASGNAIKGISVLDCVREAKTTADRIGAFLGRVS